MNLIALCEAAKKASKELMRVSKVEKDAALLCCRDALKNHVEEILTANELDIKHAKEKGIKESLIDRLMLTKERIHSMADGLSDVALLKDPIGEVVSSENTPTGLVILQRRVPIGVIGIIYESRPNVTADAFGLCFKTNNTVILRGGSDAIHSNTAIVSVLREALISCQINPDVISLVTDSSRETAVSLMKMNDYIDVLIPRGGSGLIKSVIENATVPVIETGTGNCHAYVDESADFKMALKIIENGKTQRLGVCNALESLVIHSKVAASFLPQLYECLTKKQIVFRADARARAICPLMEAATEEDYKTEYLDRLISLKIVDHIEEAIDHINRCSTGHSETIITSNYANAMKFLDEVDSACVYVNASTRFTDGNEFGFGAEIGISTQKLHARGPMGLKALTTTKYVIFGDGQIRK